MHKNATGHNGYAQQCDRCWLRGYNATLTDPLYEGKTIEDRSYEVLAQTSKAVYVLQILIRVRARSPSSLDCDMGVIWE